MEQEMMDRMKKYKNIFELPKMKLHIPPSKVLEYY